MQSLDLLGLQGDRGIAPTEADIRMMAFSFREFTNFLDKGKRLPEIAKSEAPLDALSLLCKLPVRRLCTKELSLLAREGRNSPATGSTGFAYKRSVILLAFRDARANAGKPGDVTLRSLQAKPSKGLRSWQLPRSVESVEPISTPPPLPRPVLCASISGACC
jgi:hypothetical protein